MEAIAWLGDSANWLGAGSIPFQLAMHLFYTFGALLAGATIAIPLGLYVGHTGRGEALIVGAVNTLRALPTLGVLILLVLLLAPLIASDLAFVLPTLLVLVFLAVPPLLGGIISGMRAIDRAVIDAARGMGYTTAQIVTRIEVPCALPLVLSGLRGATLQVVSTATVAAYVSLDGLGRFIIDGRAAGNYAEMVGGALIIAALAVALEFTFVLLGRWIISPGLQQRATAPHI